MKARYVVLLIVGWIASVYALGAYRARPMPYERAGWLSVKNRNVEDLGNLRNRMSDDVARHVVHIGMDREEVERLLGQSIDYGRDDVGDQAISERLPSAAKSLLRYDTHLNCDFWGECDGDAIWIVLDSNSCVIGVVQGSVWF